MESITAKVRVSAKTPLGSEQTQLSFIADYNDDRNKEWAKYTPALSLTMTVLDSVAEKFEFNQPFTLTFTTEELPHE